MSTLVGGSGQTVIEEEKMRRQIAKVIHKGVYTVIHDDSVDVNQYRIIYTANNKRTQVKRYDDFKSCMWYLMNVVSEEN